MTVMPVQVKLNIFKEISVRVFLWSLFIWFDFSNPFIREIQPEEMWMYRYPVRKSYVPNSYLWLLVFGIPLLIFVIDYMQTKNRHRLCQALLCMTLNYGLNGFLTCFFKVIVGRPRPDFFYRCFPDGKGDDPLQCSGSFRSVMDGRKSFPSGHSSFAFASMVLSSLYLAKMLHTFKNHRGDSTKFCLCLAPLLIASVVAISRTCDYHHHWQDVVCGGVLGSTIAYITFQQYFPPSVEVLNVVQNIPTSNEQLKK